MLITYHLDERGNPESWPIYIDNTGFNIVHRDHSKSRSSLLKTFFRPFLNSIHYIQSEMECTPQNRLTAALHHVMILCSEFLSPVF